MTYNKYSDMQSATKPEKTEQATNSAPAQANLNIITSKEHSVPVIMHIAYKTDMMSDGFVRIFDGTIAPRDEAFLVNRKELVGKTPEQMQQHFSLSYVPQFICDAHIPIGDSVAVGCVTNSDGKQVYVFKALTRLELSHERPLTIENIAPIP